MEIEKSGAGFAFLKTRLAWNGRLLLEERVIEMLLSVVLVPLSRSFTKKNREGSENYLHYLLVFSVLFGKKWNLSTRL